jgi:sulfur-oxidizing protein SoxA
MTARTILTSALLISACSPAPHETERPKLAPEDIVSGFTFLTPETQALQLDDFANPGFLWVDRGERLFADPAANGTACISCHANALPGVAASYPAFDVQTGSVLNLEGRINQCRVRHQGETELAYESEALLSLAAYVAYQSRGMASSVDTSGPAADAYAAGAQYFQTRRGQFNLSCQQCHTENWGKRLRGDTLSQGHGNGFPAYRLEWQGMGSLHRRLRDCDTGVRAEPLPYGDPLYIAVELYLAARSNGLELESPAIRR